MHRRREEKKESEQAGTRIRISIHVAYIHKITWYIPDGIYIYIYIHDIYRIDSG